MPVLNADLIDVGINMPAKHVKLHQKAQQYGGACTKKFGQGIDDDTKGIGTYYHNVLGDRWGGVCKALSIYWIAFHSQETSLWKWLMTPAGRLHVLHAEKVISLHGQYTGKKTVVGPAPLACGGLGKDQWTLQELRRYGLVEKKGNHNGASLTFDHVVEDTSGMFGNLFADPHAAGMRLAEALAPTYRMGGGCYRQPSIHSPSGGHALALWTAQDVAFFDPNYGEYWFEDVTSFRRWFADFWVISGYGAKYTGKCHVTCYGTGIGN